MSRQGDTGSTPTGVHFRAVRSDGTMVDVTEDVAALYDLVVCSMDFGSGFLSIEDAVPLARIADLGGFRDPDATHEHRMGRKTIIEQARDQIAAAARRSQ